MKLTFDDCKKELWFAQRVNTVIELVNKEVYTKELAYDRIVAGYKNFLGEL